MQIYKYMNILNEYVIYINLGNGPQPRRFFQPRLPLHHPGQPWRPPRQGGRPHPPPLRPGLPG